MKKMTLFIAALCFAIMSNATEGALSGKFTINANGDQIQFSKGNLQATTTNFGESWTWSFATNQWDYVGNAAANNAITGNGTVSTNGTVDLFGWSTATTYFGIHKSTESIYSGDFVDWGTNAIFNGGSQVNQWRTLTNDEWLYIFHGRTNAQNLFGLGTVNGIHGTILLPDSWTTPSGLVFYASTVKGMSWYWYEEEGYGYYYDESTSHFSDNAYTSSEWSKMEAAGAVFLPAAGSRYSTGLGSVGSGGGYWSATPYDEPRACSLCFNSNNLYPRDDDLRYFGQSVRLVNDYDGSVIGINNTSVSSKNVKRIINGQLLIERDGKIYNTQGVLMRE